MANRDWWYRIELVVSFVVGILISLVARQPMFGAILPCVLAAWPSLATGSWLLKSDPDRRRAATCFLFYLAAGCWKGAGAAFSTVVLFFIIELNTGQPPTAEEVAWTFLTMLAAITLCTVIGLVALLAAVRMPLRVWIHPRIRDARQDANGAPLPHDLPETDGAPCGFNQAIFVVAVSLVFPLIAGGCGILVLLFTGEAPNQIPLLPSLLGFAIIFGGPLSMIPIYAWVSSRIIARHPAECWGQLKSS